VPSSNQASSSSRSPPTGASLLGGPPASTAVNGFNHSSSEGFPSTSPPSPSSSQATCNSTVHEGSNQG
jgi:hypothetical protein